MPRKTIVRLESIKRTIRRQVQRVTSDIEIGVMRAMLDVLSMLAEGKTDELLTYATSPVYTMRMKAPSSAQLGRIELGGLTLYLERAARLNGERPMGDDGFRQHATNWGLATLGVRTPYMVLAQYLTLLNDYLL